MKLFVADYDDTFYTSDESIRENNKKIEILRNNGFLFAIATGRSITSIKNQVKLFNIPYDYLITSDGSIIYDNEDNILKMFEINNESIDIMKNFYDKLDFEEIQFSYKEGYKNIVDYEKPLLGINICISNDNYNEEIKNEFLKLKDIYPEYNFLAYEHTNFSYLCIKPSNVDKAYAIEYLKKKFKIRKKDIFVIGDSSNDTEMIRNYNGAGMSDSCDEILNIAKKTYNEVSDYINDILKKIIE